MNNIFYGVAIKCDTWMQMTILSRVAESYDLKPKGFSTPDFNNGMRLFVLDLSDGTYTNEEYANDDETTIDFTSFLKENRTAITDKLAHSYLQSKAICDIVNEPEGLSWPDVLKEAHDYAEKRPKGAKYRTYRDEYLSQHFTITRKSS